MSSNHVKHPFYSFIVYKEDITLHELKELCKASTLPCYISPCHDKDVYRQIDIDKYIKSNNLEVLDYSDLPFSLGETKKAHWHVAVRLPYMRSPKSALGFIQDNFSLLDINYIVPYDILNLMCRYWSHLDNPEKVQYNPREAVALNGFLVDLTKPQVPKPERDVVLDIISFIKEHRSCNFYVLFRHFYDDESVRKYIEKHTYLVNLLIEGSKNEYSR